MSLRFWQLSYRMYGFVEIRVAPLAGLIKINTDVALDVNNKHIDIGVVVRDEYGRVIKPCSNSLNSYCSVAQAEALAILPGLCFAKQSGFILESDAFSLVSLTQAKDANLSEISLVVDEISLS
ncbi:hypothetical protein ACOSQ4_019397 [Xanthoceras sorbifolium]